MRQCAIEVMSKHYDLAVIGGGSGGVGAALAAARLGVSVVLIEKGGCLGGTSVRAGVNCWEMGAGGTGIPFDLYRRLKKIPKAVGIYSFGRHGSWYKPDREPYRFPGGELVIDPRRRYVDTLQRHVPEGTAKTEAFCREHWHGVPFEPDAMARVMQESLAGTGHCTLMLNTAFVKLRHSAGRIESIELNNSATITADAYVDSTADALVCLAAGCELMVGQEAQDRFGEPSAPAKANKRVNGVSLIYRVTRKESSAVDPLPGCIPVECWWAKRFAWAHMFHYPCGDWNINVLPTMEGEEFLRLGYAAAYAECKGRVQAHWHHLQTHYAEFRDFRLSWIAPMLGIRESRRVVGEHVLTQHELLAGCSGQKHPDIIAIADHSMDTHGASTGRAGTGEVREPYGVPYRCLIPKGFKNLLIACRGASFSSLAASSCRLSRTMIQLGQAAGTAVTLAKKLNVSLPEVPAGQLREALRKQHAQVDWPTLPALREHLLAEG